MTSTSSTQTTSSSSSWFGWLPFWSSPTVKAPVPAATLASQASQCPVIAAKEEEDDDGGEGKLNPLTSMPFASRLNTAVTAVTAAEQEAMDTLDTERVTSTIPRTTPDTDSAEGESKWVYPSPYMFYNAMKRKGTANPEDIPNVASMVDIHNFLNEEVWREILVWEDMHKDVCCGPQLKRFRGRPTELSPKARFLTTFFGVPPPFDRHDWTVNRCGKDVRYVIDYYETPEETEDDVATFQVDVRPAMDSASSVYDRFRMYTHQKYGWFASAFTSSSSDSKASDDEV